MRSTIKLCYGNLSWYIDREAHRVLPKLIAALSKRTKKKLKVLTDEVIYNLFLNDLFNPLLSKLKLDTEVLLFHDLDIENLYSELCNGGIVLVIGGSLLLSSAISYILTYGLHHKVKVILFPTTPKAIFEVTVSPWHLLKHDPLNSEHRCSYRLAEVGMRYMPDAFVLDYDIISSLPFNKLKGGLIYPLKVGILFSKRLFNHIMRSSIDRLIKSYHNTLGTSVRILMDEMLNKASSSGEWAPALRYRCFGNTLSSTLSNIGLANISDEELPIISLLFELILSRLAGINRMRYYRSLELKLLSFLYSAPTLSENIVETAIDCLIKRTNVESLELVEDVGRFKEVIVDKESVVAAFRELQKLLDENRV